MSHADAVTTETDIEVIRKVSENRHGPAHCRLPITGADVTRYCALMSILDEFETGERAQRLPRSRP